MPATPQKPLIHSLPFRMSFRLCMTLEIHFVSVPHLRISYSLYFKPSFWRVLQVECPRVSQGPHRSKALTPTPGIGSGQEGPWNAKTQSDQDLSHLDIQSWWGTAREHPCSTVFCLTCASQGAFDLDGRIRAPHSPTPCILITIQNHFSS